MFKMFPLNEEYSFDLDGSFRYKDEIYPCLNLDTDFMEMVVHGISYYLPRRWLALISHYEVNLPMSELMKISFEECKSKVLGLKCGYLMVFSSRVRLDDDFFVIPGFTRFAINLYGDVKSIEYGRFLKPSIGPYGYPYVNVYDADKGGWRSVSLHILLARTFVKNPDPSSKFFVNHKDGDKLNFRLNNLEWVTSLENQQHAIETGLRADNQPCKVFDTVTKSVTHFSSVGTALKAMGLRIRDAKIVSKVNGLVIPTLFQGRYEIKPQTDESDWYYNDVNRIERKAKTMGPFEAKRIASSEVFEASTIKALARLLDMTPSPIEDALRSIEPMATNGYLFRTKTFEPWPSSWGERVYTKPRKIKLTDVESEEVKIFESLRQAILFLGIDKRTLKSRLSTGTPYGKWKIEEIR